MIREDLKNIPFYVPGKQGPNLLRLASNETSAQPLESVSKAISEAALGINRYPDMGATELRERIAEWFARTNADSPATGAPTTTLTRNNVAVGNGSTAMCLQSIQATCNDGDEVLFAWRSFEAYPILAKIAGATPVQVPLTADHRHDFDAMLSAITPRTRLIFVCNPNNPTGTVMTHREVEEFIERVPDHIHVVVDEAYQDYDRTPEKVNAAALVARFPHVALCRTFSKAYGLAGVRLGFMIGAPDFIEAINKVGIPFGVNALAQVAGLASVTEEAGRELSSRVDATIEQRDRVSNSLPSELRTPSHTNFLWLPLGDKAAAFNQALLDAGVVARAFPGDGVRVTVTDHTETEQLIPALRQALEAVGLEPAQE